MCVRLGDWGRRLVSRIRCVFLGALEDRPSMEDGRRAWTAEIGGRTSVLGCREWNGVLMQWVGSQRVRGYETWLAIRP
jgi:hypothetical protein